MEQEDGWLTVLEKNGLGPAEAILENYGIDSETDLTVEGLKGPGTALVCIETRSLVWSCV
jgi:hypothetical protein